MVNKLNCYLFMWCWRFKNSIAYLSQRNKWMLYSSCTLEVAFYAVILFLLICGTVNHYVAASKLLLKLGCWFIVQYNFECKCYVNIFLVKHSIVSEQKRFSFWFQSSIGSRIRPTDEEQKLRNWSVASWMSMFNWNCRQTIAVHLNFF